MGWDITYHPLGEDEIRSLYFAGLKDDGVVPRLAQKFKLSERGRAKVAKILARGRAVAPTEPFGTGHGFMLAALAGCLRPYWYIRGGALSFLEDFPEITRRFADWKELVPSEYIPLVHENLLTDNYCAGVFLRHDTLKKLRADYEKDPETRKILEGLFDHGRMDVFLAAVDYALRHKLGIMEATDVLVPDAADPANVDKALSPSDPQNSAPMGLALYRDEVMSRSREFAAMRENAGKSITEDAQATGDE